MPLLAWWLIAGGIAAAGAGGAIKLVGSGVDDAGNASLKFAGAAAVGVGLWIAFKRLG